MTPDTRNADAIGAVLTTALAMHGLSPASVRQVAVYADRKGLVASDLLPDEIREPVLALVRTPGPVAGFGHA